MERRKQTHGRGRERAGDGASPFEQDDGDDDADDEHHGEDRPHHPQHLGRFHAASHAAVLHHHRVRVRAGGENALQEQRKKKGEKDLDSEN